MYYRTFTKYALLVAIASVAVAPTDATATLAQRPSANVESFAVTTATLYQVEVAVTVVSGGAGILGMSLSTRNPNLDILRDEYGERRVAPDEKASHVWRVSVQRDGTYFVVATTTLSAVEADSEPDFSAVAKSAVVYFVVKDGRVDYHGRKRPPYDPKDSQRIGREPTLSTTRPSGPQNNSTQSIHIDGRLSYGVNEPCHVGTYGVPGVRVYLEWEEAGGTTFCPQFAQCTATTDDEGFFSFDFPLGGEPLDSIASRLILRAWPSNSAGFENGAVEQGAGEFPLGVGPSDHTIDLTGLTEVNETGLEFDIDPANGTALRWLHFARDAAFGRLGVSPPPIRYHIQAAEGAYFQSEHTFHKPSGH